MFDLSGKVALVTGGGRGIGAGCSRWLAAAGAYVIINYAGHKERAEQTLEQIRAAGGDGEIIKADVSKLEEVDAMFEHIKTKFGRLDIHVNNAGVLSRHPFLELPVEEWDRLFNTNARGYFICGQRAARLMAEQGKGRIINISSDTQYRAGVNRTHYAATKGAIGMLTKNMAKELGQYGITVNTIAPGSISTDFNSDVLSDPAFVERLVKTIPAGRVGVPDDIGAAAVFLASDEASFVNGAYLLIDGGMCA